MDVEVNFTKSNRNDGLWVVDLTTDDGLSVYKKRENGSIRPICNFQDADIVDGGECAGNFALIAAAPEMYRLLFETAKLIRFMILRPSSTEAERAEYRSIGGPIEDVLRNIAKIEEHLQEDAVRKEQVIENE